MKSTFEGASHQLARWDMTQLGWPWSSNLVLQKLCTVWELVGAASRLFDTKLHVQPLENLSTVELRELRYIQEAFGTICMDITDCGYSVYAYDQI